MEKLTEKDIGMIVSLYKETSKEEAFKQLKHNFISKEFDLELNAAAANYYGFKERNDGSCQRKGGQVSVLLRKFREEALESILTPVKDKVCNKFEYCKKRNNGDFENETGILVIAVADALLTVTTNIPLIASGSAYIIKNHLLDKWCNCGKAK